MARTMTTTEPSAWTWTHTLAFGSRPASLWASFCEHCRHTSLDTKMSRPLQDLIAWDVAGPVSAHWNETLLPMITEYRNKNSREILHGCPWDGTVDCWMVGTTPKEAIPHIIINCSNDKIAKRYEKLIKKDSTIQGSGFRICRRRGNIRYRTSKADDVEDLDRSFANTSPTPSPSAVPEDSRYRSSSSVRHRFLGFSLSDSDQRSRP